MPTYNCKPLPPLTPADIARFWSKVDVRGPDECWPWTPPLMDVGYGCFCVTQNGKTVWLYAHRVAFFLHYGYDPIQHLICHKCPGGADNKWCVNWAHMYAGTDATNANDRDIRGSLKFPAFKGEDHHAAKLTEKEVLEVRGSNLPAAILAKQYVVSTTTIYAIRKKMLWKHI